MSWLKNNDHQRLDWFPLNLSTCNSVCWLADCRHFALMHVPLKTKRMKNPVVFCVDGDGNERVVFPTAAATIIPPGDNLSVSTLKE